MSCAQSWLFWSTHTTPSQTQYPAGVIAPLPTMITHTTCGAPDAKPNVYLKTAGCESWLLVKRVEPRHARPPCLIAAQPPPSPRSKTNYKHIVHISLGCCEDTRQTQTDKPRANGLTASFRSGAFPELNPIPLTQLTDGHESAAQSHKNTHQYCLMACSK